MLIPGGLVRDSARRRRAAWRPLDGRLELAVAEQGASGESLPVRVSAAIAAALEHIDGEPVSIALAGELCVADRQFLMHRLAELFGMGHTWQTVICARCAERFDFDVRLGDLPVREAGAGFPFAEIETSIGVVRARVPTGADQAAVLEETGGEDAELALCARCVVAPASLSLDALTGEDIARIEDALEDVSPAVVTAVQAACPACGNAQEAKLDPYLVLRKPPAESVLEDVHVLAASYHWSERDILALPRERRRFYLARVDRARGMAS